LSVSASTVYVYGVMAASDGAAVSAAGVEGSDVRIVEHEELAALVSGVTGGALAAAREVRAHWRVIEEASKLGTVLPVLFGTVLASEQAVRDELLDPNKDRLAELLAALAGRVQLNVKAEYEQEHLMREVIRDAPAIDAMRQRLRTVSQEAGYYERIRMGEAVAAEVERRRERDTGLALDRLTRLSVASRREPATGPDGAFNLSFLVEDDGVERFSKAVGELADELGDRARLRYVGPLPPYSFAEMHPAEASAAWA
jgi:Gas vesicle synthesis protein GvpL/GvpF